MISENVALAGLRNGKHNVTVYAKNLVGHVDFSQTIIFTIAKPEPFPASMLIAPFASVAFLGLILVVYLKRREK